MLLIIALIPALTFTSASIIQDRAVSEVKIQLSATEQCIYIPDPALPDLAFQNCSLAPRWKVNLDGAGTIGLLDTNVISEHYFEPVLDALDGNVKNTPVRLWEFDKDSMGQQWQVIEGDKIAVAGHSQPQYCLSQTDEPGYPIVLKVCGIVTDTPDSTIKQVWNFS